MQRASSTIKVLTMFWDIVSERIINQACSGVRKGTRQRSLPRGNTWTSFWGRSRNSLEKMMDIPRKRSIQASLKGDNGLGKWQAVGCYWEGRWSCNNQLWSQIKRPHLPRARVWTFSRQWRVIISRGQDDLSHILEIPLYLCADGWGKIMKIAPCSGPDERAWTEAVALEWMEET